MREVGTVREFKNGRYEIVENNIIPEKGKKKFVIIMNVCALAITFGGIIVMMAIMGSGEMDFLGLGILIIGYFLYIVVHELLHGITFTLDKHVNWSLIKFGVVLKSGMAYCISTVPVKVKISRLSLMMPVYVVCIPMIVLALVFHNATLAIGSMFFLSGSVGDFYYMWKLRKTNKDLYMYEEMPVDSGYEIGYLLYKKID